MSSLFYIGIHGLKFLTKPLSTYSCQPDRLSGLNRYISWGEILWNSLNAELMSWGDFPPEIRVEISYFQTIFLYFEPSCLRDTLFEKLNNFLALKKDIFRGKMMRNDNILSIKRFSWVQEWYKIMRNVLDYYFGYKSMYFKTVKLHYE